MREQRKRIAEETLKIQQQGFYIAPSGKRIDIKTAQKRSEESSQLITPADGKQLVGSIQPLKDAPRVPCEVINVSTVQAIIDARKTSDSVAALNFASARNPGGGFLNGAMAQEEALATSSGLYSTQLKHNKYYEANRSNTSMMYTDYVIYSPDVVFFRDVNYNLLETPVTANILTLPAVNLGQVKAKGEDISRAKKVMKDRMRLCLAILASEKNEVIILSAYGAGVFGNDANDVARNWQELLFSEGYGGFFKRIIFAVLDKPNGENIRPFEQLFG
jgi:uncharacterized protein (TIGR02452 family)